MKVRPMLLTLLSALTLATLAGCQTTPPQPGTKGSLQLFRNNITVDDDWLGNQQLGFGVPQVQHIPGGLAKVSVAITNVSNDPLTLEYQYIFTVDNLIMESPMPFTRVDLAPGQTKDLATNSKDPLPASPRGNWSLELRKMKVGG